MVTKLYNKVQQETAGFFFRGKGGGPIQSPVNSEI